MLVIGGSDLRQLADLNAVIESQRDAYRSASEGTMTAEGVLTAINSENDALVFAVTGAIVGSTGATFKVGSENPGNAARGLPAVQSAVLLTDPLTSEVLACLNGSELTALRTSAGIAAAADALARRDATSLGIIGSGAQAREVARTVSVIRPLSEIRIWSRTAERRDALVAALNEDPEIAATVVTASGARAASECDIVVTCTTSHDPVVEGEWLRPGTTVLTIGSYAPERREIDVRTSERAGGTYVDDVEKSLEWSGPLREAISQGVVEPHDVTPIGAVLSGEVGGRLREDDILIFHSLGLAIQDATLGWMIFERAMREGLGTNAAF